MMFGILYLCFSAAVSDRITRHSFSLSILFLSSITLFLWFSLRSSSFLSLWLFGFVCLSVCLPVCLSVCIYTKLYPSLALPSSSHCPSNHQYNKLCMYNFFSIHPITIDATSVRLSFYVSAAVYTRVPCCSSTYYVLTTIAFHKYSPLLRSHSRSSTTPHYLPVSLLRLSVYLSFFPSVSIIDLSNCAVL